MDYTSESILIALSLTVIAGLSTGVGALLAFFAPGTNRKYLSFALGLSAGVMIFISFLDLMPEAMEDFSLSMSGDQARLFTLAAFFAGLGLIAIIDRLVPEDENPHEAHSIDELTRPNNHHLKRTGMAMALAIGIHNFPEGMAVFVSGLDSAEVALPVVLAIAIHNIPEGMAVAVPIYSSTGNRKKALKYSMYSGLAEPLGALVGLAILLPFWSPTVNAWCLAGVAGVMVYISFDELLPEAEKYGHHHWSISGVVSGMLLMAIALSVL